MTKPMNIAADFGTEDPGIRIEDDCIYYSPWYIQPVYQDKDQRVIIFFKKLTFHCSSKRGG